MNAGTAGHVGTAQLKQFHMAYIKTKFPRGISDQAISDSTATAKDSVRPGSGLKHQASSFKRQASSAKLTKQQATSVKPQAQRFKRQATSVKLFDH